MAKKTKIEKKIHIYYKSKYQTKEKIINNSYNYFKFIIIIQILIYLLF